MNEGDRRFAERKNHHTFSNAIKLRYFTAKLICPRLRPHPHLSFHRRGDRGLVG